ncbi:helix-turn-helix transcriptional regulator [Catenulispora sp. NL8]|uniref:Helix-turn-helix transcriptional regulator n=1 Tax=Catenulispora pinistramenti TaxID=2705254 RepID=A0ABS5L7S7_9ACTN|nr:helix-turn-helix transcriptional regulator [Catenulispora pinistramenti]MBS2554379.1 helix-turn-helix transcriptional regulator [Catenulispora pinistramenti]
MAKSGPWAGGRLRAAWASGDWRGIFREYRRATGVSQLTLGSMVGMPQSHVSLIESGKRKVTSAELIARITEGLEVPDELRGLPERSEALPWSPDPELNERIARAQSVGKLDVRSADWIAHVLAEHRRAEDVIGGRDLWVVVRAQLDTVTKLLPNVSGAVADRLLILAAEHAHWLSWVAAGEGQHGPALAWLDLANGWAIDAGSSDMASWVARVRSFYTLERGDPVRALRLAEVAQQTPGMLSPAAASIATHAACLAAAAVGERDRSRRLAEESYDFALQVPDADTRPGWLYWLDPVRAKLQYGMASYAVRDWSAAIDALQQGVSALDGYPRDQAYYLAKLEDARQRL